MLRFLTLAKRIHARNLIPILDCVMIDGKNQNVRFTDMDIELRTPYLIKGEPLQVMIPITHIHKFLSKTKAKTAAIKIIDQKTVEINGVSFSLNFTEPGDYPIFIEKEEKVSIGKILASEIKPLLNFQSAENTKYWLNGICIRGDRFIATDGHRARSLVTREVFCTKENETILPKNLTGIIAASGCNWDISISKKGNRISLKEMNPDGGMTIEAKMIDGTFPEYDRVIPADHDSYGRFTLPVKKLRDFVANAAWVQEKDGSKVIRFDTETGEMRLTMKGCTEIKKVFPGAFIGHRLLVPYGFNSRYLLDVLDGREGEIEMRINGRATDTVDSRLEPAVIYFKDFPALQTILMPARVS